MAMARADDRFVYEPRALWTVQRIQAAASNASILSARVQIPKDDFRNVGKYPITLTKLILDGVGYAYRSYTPGASVSASEVHNCEAAVGHVDFQLSSPYSRHFSKRQFRLQSFEQTPTAEPSMQYASAGGVAQVYSSGLFGINRWAFDMPLRLPRKSTIGFELSGWTVPNVGLALPGAIIHSSIAFDEEDTGLFGGTSRIRVRTQVPQLRNQSIGAPFWPTVTDPLPPDAFQVISGAETNTFPANQMFRAPNFNRQESDRGQDWTSFTGFAVHIDQITWDDYVQTAAAPFPGQPLSPQSLRMITRCKTTNGGTNQWWWRPGAPLALVCPTITPAQVYEFEEPITLGPGEQLEGELWAPVGPSLVLGSSGGAQTVRPNYTIGVSMTGYTTIE
jgi:hypothetical protein